MSMATKRYYVEANNPEGRFFPGVPLRDLTDDEYEALPAWLQRNVDASDFYRATNPNPTPRKRTADADVTEETTDG